MTKNIFKAFVLSTALGSTPAFAEDIHIEKISPENMYGSLGVNYWNLCFVENADGRSLFPEFCDASKALDEDKEQRQAICVHDFDIRKAEIDLEAKQKNLGYDEKQKLWHVAYDAKEACNLEILRDTDQKRSEAFRNHIGSSLTITLSR